MNAGHGRAAIIGGATLGTARTEAVRSRRRRLLYPLQLPQLPPLPAGWPLASLLVGFPVWWLLGMRVIIVPLLAVPMALELLRRRPIRVPPYFGLWMLFLLWFVTSVAMLRYDPPRTLGDVGTTGILSMLMRLSEYGSVTIALLYAGNLSEQELPRRRLVGMLAFFFLVVVAGGLFAMLRPEWEMVSPVELALPDSVAGNLFVQSLVHPQAAQVHDVLGYTIGRPAAPFGYTNMWGNVLNILLPWFVVGWLVYGSQPRRVVAPVLLFLALLPAIYSLNRGLWIGLVLSGLYLGVRLALRGKLWAIGWCGFAVVAGALVFAVTPLHEVVQDRLASPHSNDIRTFTVTRTFEASAHSPVLGYGNPRKALGSANSIAIGSTPECQQCGNPVLGSTGQLWLVLISQGYVGAALYVSFFVATALRYLRDPTPIGIAATMVVLLSLFYLLVYNALVTPLLVTMLAVALLWRNEGDERRGATETPPRGASAHYPLARRLT